MRIETKLIKLNTNLAPHVIVIKTLCIFTDNDILFLSFSSFMNERKHKKLTPALNKLGGEMPESIEHNPFEVDPTALSEPRPMPYVHYIIIDMTPDKKHSIPMFSKVIYDYLFTH